MKSGALKISKLRLVVWVAFGAVDDGLGGGVPSDLLEGASGLCRSFKA